MKNSALKRIIAVVLCLVVFAGSELTGVTNIVGDLFAAEEEMEAEEQSDDAEEEEPAEDVVEISVEDETSDGGEGQAAETEPAIEESNAESAETETAGAEGEGGQQETVETEQPPVESAAADNGPAETEDQTSEEKQPDAEPAADAEGAENAEKQPEAAVDADANTETVTGEEKQPDAEAVTDENKQLITEDKTVEEAQLKTEEPEQPEVPIEEEDQQEEEELAYPEFDEETSAGDGKVKIHVTAEEGVLPEGTELSVKPIVEQDVEALEADSEVSEEEVQEAKEIQQQFEAVKEELDATVADDDAKEIAHFLAYDISFYLEDEDGESGKIEPDGDVTVRMEFEEAFIPDSIANEAEVTLDSVDVVHMKETEDGLKAEVMTDAQISTVEDDKVADAEFVSDIFSIYAIAWIGEINPGTGNYIYEDEDVVITVTPVAEDALPENAKLQVIPILPEKDEEQYQQVADRLMEKAENEEYAIAGFLAYDISFVDAEGNKVEPDGEVKVAMNYKEAKIPAEVDGTAYSFADNAEASETETAADAELNVTVMHLEENEAGSVNVVDMAEQNKVTALETTKEQKIQNAEFVTGGFSVFTITWTWDIGNSCIYEDDEIKITVTAIDRDAIPEGATLSITPIKAEREETAEQYQDVAEKLIEKAVNENYDITGFLAYDITLTGEDGTEIEPNGKVKVTMEYKQPAPVAEIDEDIRALVSEELVDEAEEKAGEENVVSEEASGSDTGIQPETVEGEDAQTAATEAAEISSGTSTVVIPLGGEDQDEENQANVTVMHLEEDQEGSVVQVVDMAEAGKLENLEVGENQEIKKAEFTTESFSVYTITWGSGRNIKTLNITFKDTSNNDISVPDYVAGQVIAALGYNTPFEISQISENGAYSGIYEFTNGDRSYLFRRAANIWDKDYDINKGNDIDRLIIESQNSNVRWRKKGETGYRDYNEQDKFYFIYDDKPVNNNAPLEEETTLDNNLYGITIKMKDMTLAKQNELLGDTGNWWTGGGVTQGAAERVLDASGYPVVKRKDSETKYGTAASLESLFRGGEKVTGLFREDIYEDTGYFEYSSFENYAYLGEGTKFKVYKQIGTPDDGDVYFLKRGNFFPYNDIAAGEFSYNKNLYDEHGKGNLLTSENDRYGEQLYKAQETINYNFGMEMSATFMQPEGGMVDGKVMKYEFNGDDDLWVFIDNVLVLDMGGNHDAQSGYIDFSDGTVHVDGVTTNTTIREMFELAAKENPGKVDMSDIEGDTFKDYSTHDLRMFYMERGKEAWDNASNLHMKMNLPTIPSNAVEVEKRLAETDQEKYTDIRFAFQVYAQKVDLTSAGKENETYLENEYVTLNNAVYRGTTTPITFLPKETINGTEYENVFYLRPGEIAQFPELQNNRKYYVAELGVKTEEYERVIIDKTELTQFNNGSQVGAPSNAFISTPMEVSKRKRVTYTNSCSAENQKELHITKRMADGQSAGDDTFTFRVTLGTEEGSDTPKLYEGEYYLKDKEGYTVVYENGKLVRKQAPFGTASKGLITGVPAGYTAAIVRIPSGTSFTVSEVLSGDKYASPVITGTAGTYEEISGAAEGTKAGRILLGENAEITVTNSLKVLYSWEIVKKSSSPVSTENDEVSRHNSLKGAEFILEKVDDNNAPLTGEEKAVYHGISKEDDGIVTWYDNTGYEGDSMTAFSEGRYLLTETKAPGGYAMNGVKLLIVINADGQPEITTADGTALPSGYLVTSNSTENGVNRAHTTLYYENAPLYELPETGGIGIHWYIVSGTLMMMLGLLILYKRKFAGEVLKG